MSEFYKTGEIQLFEVKDVKLLDENLHITIEGDYSHVDVTYILNNNSTEKEVDFGFPVDFSFYADTSESIKKQLESKEEYDFLALTVKDYQISLNGDTTEVFYEYDDKYYTDSIPIGNMILDAYFGRKWFLSKLNLKQGKNTLNVKYTVENNLDDGDQGPEFITSDFVFVSPRRFRYDFSPAAFWGDGTADNFSMIVDAKDIINKNGSVVLMGIEEPMEQFREFNFSQSNFEFNNADMIEIEYNYKDFILSKLLDEWAFKTEEYDRISASSGTETDKLIDRDLATNFLIDASKGAWIEFDFDATIDFFLLAVVNGNLASKKDYRNYSRIKRLRVELWINWAGREMRKDTIFFDFDDVPYSEYDKQNFIKMAKADYFGELKDGVYKVRMIIEDVYRGKKSRKVCIPEIFIGTYKHDNSQMKIHSKEN